MSNLNEALLNEAEFVFDGNIDQAENYVEEIFDFLEEYGDYVTVEIVYASADKSTDDQSFIYAVPHFEPSEEELNKFVSYLEDHFDKIEFKRFV